MGNIEEFIVRVRFDNDGQASEVVYWDQEGCGHERVITLHAKIVNLVDYHLNHYRVSHKMVPRKRCPMQMFGVDPQTQKPVSFRCILTPHSAEVKHTLEQY